MERKYEMVKMYGEYDKEYTYDNEMSNEELLKRFEKLEQSVRTNLINLNKTFTYSDGGKGADFLEVLWEAIEGYTCFYLNITADRFAEFYDWANAHKIRL